MAEHPRTLIRNAALAALAGQTRAAITETSRRPDYQSKAWGTELPSVAIFTRRETARVFNAAPLQYERHCELTVEVLVEGKSRASIDVDLDELCRQIELLLTVDDTLGGTCNALTYIGTELDYSDKGDPNIAGARISFDAEYLDFLPGDRMPDLPWLERVWVDYSLENKQPDPADQAHSHIEGLAP